MITLAGKWLYHHHRWVRSSRRRVYPAGANKMKQGPADEGGYSPTPGDLSRRLNYFSVQILYFGLHHNF
jgi:hypothetical protein